MAFDDPLQSDGVVGNGDNPFDASGKDRDASFDPEADGKYAKDAETAAAYEGAAG